MAKVVTSQGIEDFVRSGKHETIVDKAPVNEKEAPPLEVIKNAPTTDIGGSDKAPEDDGLEDDDKEFPETVRKKIGKKHRAMKEAQEAAQEAERFAENQYNRARLAEERAANLERQLQETTPKAKEPEITRPVHDEKNADGSSKWYNDKGEFKAFEYAEALAAYSAGKAVAEDRAKQVEELQRAQAKAAEEAAKAKVAEFRKTHPDYDEVMQGDVQTHNAVLQYLSASDHIAEIAYYLQKNPDFVERINKLNPLKAIAEIGKLELTFEKPKGETPPVVTKVGAPPPIQPLSSQSQGHVQTDPSKMNFRELRQYEKERAKRRH